jgi:hypothetical protein
MANEVELVPCPSCGWVNKGAVKAYRKRFHRNLPWLAAAIVPGGYTVASCLFVGLEKLFPRRSPVPISIALVLTAVSLFSPLWLLVLKAFLRRRINPNKSYPGRPEVPLGTPPAILEKKAPSGSAVMQAVPNRYTHSDKFAGWAVFRSGQIFFPPVCCSCLAPATTAFEQPLWLGMKKAMAVPLCAHCASKVLRTWLLTAAASVAGALVLAALPADLIAGIDVWVRGWIFVLVAAFVAAFGVLLLPARICRPYRLRILSADPEIYALKARHRAFTEDLINQVRQSNESVPNWAATGNDSQVLIRNESKLHLPI